MIPYVYIIGFIGVWVEYIMVWDAPVFGPSFFQKYIPFWSLDLPIVFNVPFKFILSLSYPIFAYIPIWKAMKECYNYLKQDYLDWVERKK